jgi:hypothetical protein
LFEIIVIKYCLFFFHLFLLVFLAAESCSVPPPAIVFGAVSVKRGEKNLTCQEARQAIPSFYSDGLESHIQKHPWAEIRYANYPIASLCSRFQMADSSFEFEFARSGYAPIQAGTTNYVHFDRYEVRDCLQSNFRTQRFVPEMQAILVINMMIPAWGCLHTRGNPNIHAFFRCYGSDVDVIQLDNIWTRYCMPFRYQFSNCVDGRFSRVSTVRVFVDHHAISGDWKVKANVFRFNPHFIPSELRCSTVQSREQCPPPIPEGYVEISFQAISEQLSASRLSNVKRKRVANSEEDGENV